MKPNRVPDALLNAGHDAIRAWYAAHPSHNAYLGDREQMRIVLAVVLTLHNEQVEQPLRERAEKAEAELAELRERFQRLVGEQQPDLNAADDVFEAIAALRRAAADPGRCRNRRDLHVCIRMPHASGDHLDVGGWSWQDEDQQQSEDGDHG